MRLGDFDSDTVSAPIFNLRVSGTLTGEIEVVLCLVRLAVLGSVKGEIGVASSATPVVDLLDIVLCPLRLTQL
jgi:hypothetical protein